MLNSIYPNRRNINASHEIPQTRCIDSQNVECKAAIIEAEKTSDQEVSCHDVANGSTKLIKQGKFSRESSKITLRSSITRPLRRLSRKSINRNLQEEIYVNDEKPVPRSSLVPLWKISQNFEQVVTNIFQSKTDVNKELTKGDQIKSKICGVLKDKEEFKKFKEYARNNNVTTNIGVQQMLFWYADSKNVEVNNHTNYFVNGPSFSTSTECFSRFNPHSNQYRVKKDEKGGYQWINAPDVKKVEPIRRRLSTNT